MSTKAAVKTLWLMAAILFTLAGAASLGFIAPPAFLNRFGSNARDLFELVFGAPAAILCVLATGLESYLRGRDNAGPP